MKPRALLVTPDRSGLNLCATALGMKGFDVARAEIHAYARSLLETHRPHVVVVEYPYQLDGGFAFLAELQDRRQPGTLKVVVITGFRTPDDFATLVEQQADATLPAWAGPSVLANEAMRLAGRIEI
jgi:ActR/RegA family two-component response regulator